MVAPPRYFFASCGMDSGSISSHWRSHDSGHLPRDRRFEPPELCAATRADGVGDGAFLVGAEQECEVPQSVGQRIELADLVGDRKGHTDGEGSQRPTAAPPRRRHNLSQDERRKCSTSFLTDRCHTHLQRRHAEKRWSRQSVFYSLPWEHRSSAASSGGQRYSGTETETARECGSQLSVMWCRRPCACSTVDFRPTPVCAHGPPRA